MTRLPASNGGQRAGAYRIARSKDSIYVRVAGLATMNNSDTLDAFLDKMQEEGYRAFVVDLADCRGVDSTFMGILSKLRDGLVVVNANDHCRKQLRSVGLDRVARIQEGPADLPEKLELHELPSAQADPIARLKLIRKAHEALIALDRKNEEKFGAFLEDIAKNLGGR